LSYIEYAARRIISTIMQPVPSWASVYLIFLFWRYSQTGT